MHTHKHYGTLNRKVTVYGCMYACRATRTCTYVCPVRAPIRNPSYIDACNYSQKCRSLKRLQHFYWSSSLKCESLASGAVVSAIHVSVAVFYSPVIWISYDSIFRLKKQRIPYYWHLGKSCTEITHCLTNEWCRATKLDVLKFLHQRRNAPRQYYTNTLHLQGSFSQECTNSSHFIYTRQNDLYISLLRP